MAGFAVYITAHRQLAFMPEHRLEFCRLANNAQHRLDRALLQHAEQRANAQTADFFVIGQGNVYRYAQRRLHQRRHQRQHAGDIALHVCRAPAKQLAVVFGQLERRRCPGLAIHRHHVGMPRQHNAGALTRANAGKQIGLAAFFVVNQLAAHAKTCQVIAYKLDQMQVGLAACSVKPHQRVQQFAAAAHRSSPATP